MNGILGRGKHVTAEAIIPPNSAPTKTTAHAVADLNVKKNLIGTLLAGGVRSANAHFANMLLAFYLATGQDAANIVEGSQGLVHAEDRDGDLYFAVTLPNIIVGTVGNGKDLDFVRENLELLGCLETREPGAPMRDAPPWPPPPPSGAENSLMAALTNEGELMAAHKKLERHA